MKVILTANNRLTFVDGVADLNENDDLVHFFTVVPEIPLAGKEKLQVAFQQGQIDSSGEIVTARLDLLKKPNENEYRVLIPESVLAIADVWSVQVFRMRETASGSVATKGSAVEYFTVSHGIVAGNGEKVTSTVLQTLWNEAVEAVEMSTAASATATEKAEAAEASAQSASASEAIAAEKAREAVESADNAAADKMSVETAKEAVLLAQTVVEQAAVAATSAQELATASATAAQASEERAGQFTAMAEASAQNVAKSEKNVAEDAKAAKRAKDDAEDAAESAQDAANKAEEKYNAVVLTANGLAKALSFDNYAKAVAFFLSTDIEYAVGQPFYIITKDVPDLWISAVAETYASYQFVSDTWFLDDIKANGGKLQVGRYYLSEQEGPKVELSNLQPKEDAGLETTAKTIVGAINELNEKELPVDEFVKKEEFDEYTIESLTENSKDLTDGQKTNACDWLGAVLKPTIDKIGGTNKVIGIDSDGNTRYWNANPVYIYSIDSYGYVIPVYKKAGKEIINESANPDNTIYVADPQLDYEASNKRYVDNLPDYLTLTDDEKDKWREFMGTVPKFNPEANGRDSMWTATNERGTWRYIQVNAYTAAPWYIPAYMPENIGDSTSGGYMLTETPTRPYHSANKNYIDNLPDYLALTDEQKAKWKAFIQSILS